MPPPPPPRIGVPHAPPPGYAPPRRRRSRFPLSLPLIVALCGVVAGAVVEVSGSSTIEVNGVLTDCDYVNLGPVLFGPVAVVAGLWAVLARKRRPPAPRPLELGLGLACATLGVFQVLAGLGILGGVRLSLDAGNPC